ncbi:MAG: glycosyltransferase family 4 protein [Rhodospirillaceae bacterium]|nr:glycosyltransferase family 4 protein [Rhodospirillaceae bacterium]
MTKILHITPHLGGGVGKVLSSLVSHASRLDDGFDHEILCMEKPEKDQFVNVATAAGCKVFLCPTDTEIKDRIRSADIVQLEFWNHPATAQFLCGNNLPDMRLLVWCHVSGLNFPRIPPKLFKVADKFMFTSECSFEATEVKELTSEERKKLDVVSSGVGVEDLPRPNRQLNGRKVSVGYFGSLNFSKLHPDFVSFLSAVDDPDFQVSLIGDETNRNILEKQCKDIGQPELLKFKGYITDIATELSKLDVLVYLLNPLHYGTAENALLEAMAMGVIPIVLDNLAEKCIVDDGITGIVVRNSGELANALKWLGDNEEERLAMSARAATAVRERCTYSRMISKLNENYLTVVEKPKKPINFKEIFGKSPKDWFRSFNRDIGVFSDNGTVKIANELSRHALYERKKGSVFHFLEYFPDDQKLQQWANNIQNMKS